MNSIMRSTYTLRVALIIIAINYIKIKKFSKTIVSIQVNELSIESMAHCFRVHEAHSHLQLSMTEYLAYFLHHGGTL